jgi:hypothetical protein
LGNWSWENEHNLYQHWTIHSALITTQNQANTVHNPLIHKIPPKKIPKPILKSKIHGTLSKINIWFCIFLIIVQIRQSQKKCVFFRSFQLSIKLSRWRFSTVFFWLLI